MADRSIGFDTPPLKSSRPGEQGSGIVSSIGQRVMCMCVYARRHVQVQVKCVAIRSAGTSIEDKAIRLSKQRDSNSGQSIEHRRFVEWF